MRIGEEHLRVGLAQDAPSLLLAITDVEESEPLVSWPALFADVGPRVKVLATVEGDDAAALAWIPRLGFDPPHVRPEQRHPAQSLRKPPGRVERYGGPQRVTEDVCAGDPRGV